MKTYDVQYVFTGGFNWLSIEAESAEDAIAKARAKLDDVDECDDIYGNASNYDDVGDLKTITAEGPDEFADFVTPEEMLLSASSEMLAALKLAQLALNTSPSFRVTTNNPTVRTSYQVASIIDRAIKLAEKGE